MSLHRTFLHLSLTSAALGGDQGLPDNPSGTSNIDTLPSYSRNLVTKPFSYGGNYPSTDLSPRTTRIHRQRNQSRRHSLPLQRLLLRPRRLNPMLSREPSLLQYSRRHLLQPDSVLVRGGACSLRRC